MPSGKSCLILSSLNFQDVGLCHCLYFLCNDKSFLGPANGANNKKIETLAETAERPSMIYVF